MSEHVEVRLVSRLEAAKYLGVSVWTIDRLVHSGHLRKCWIGSIGRYDIQDLNNLITKDVVKTENAQPEK